MHFPSPKPDFSKTGFIKCNLNHKTELEQCKSWADSTVWVLYIYFTLYFLLFAIFWSGLGIKILRQLLEWKNLTASSIYLHNAASLGLIACVENVLICTTELCFFDIFFVLYITKCCFPCPCNGVWQKVAYSPHTPNDISRRWHVGSPVKNTARGPNTVNFVPNFFFVPFFFF